jgi:hypothetical protein
MCGFLLRGFGRDIFCAVFRALLTLKLIDEPYMILIRRKQVSSLLHFLNILFGMSPIYPVLVFSFSIDLFQRGLSS